MCRALLIVGKAPRPGFAKTRLVPHLSTEDAAVLYRGLLLDSVSLGLDLGWEQVTVVHPRGGGPSLAALLPTPAGLPGPHGHGPTDARTHAFATHLAQGFQRVVLIGSDNPTLPRAWIEQACLAL